VRALERAGHRDPVAVDHDLVCAEVRVRERVEPDHRVAGDGVAALEVDAAWPLEDAVVSGERTDRLLVVRVERVHPRVERGAGIRHEHSPSVVSRPAARIYSRVVRAATPGGSHRLRELSELPPISAIRTVLLPAAMRLLGWLGWLPRIRIGGAAAGARSKEP
jgi:hypothetical protein